jgi:hypothetical protein
VLLEQMEEAHRGAWATLEAEARTRLLLLTEDHVKRGAAQEERDAAVAAHERGVEEERAALRGRFSGEQSAADAAVASLRAHPSFRAERVCRRDVPLISEFKAHGSVVASIEYVHDADTAHPWLVTTGGDKMSHVWTLEGQELGEMSTGSSAHVRRWKFRIDAEARRRNQFAAAQVLEEEMRAIERAAAEEEARQKLKLGRRPHGAEPSHGAAAAEDPAAAAAGGPAGQAGISSSSSSSSSKVLPRRRGSNFKLGRTKVAGPPEEERERLFGQMSGSTTWVRSAMEIASADAAHKEEERLQKEERRKRRAQRRQKKKQDPFGFGADGGGGGGKEQQQEDPTLALLQETAAEQAQAAGGDGSGGGGMHDMPKKPAAGLSDKHLDAEDNWSMGSVNRQKDMYSNMYAERGRLEAKLDARRSKAQSVAPSDFLLRQLGTGAAGRSAAERKGRRRGGGSSAAKASALLQLQTPEAQIDAFIATQQDALQHAFTQSSPPPKAIKGVARGGRPGVVTSS